MSKKFNDIYSEAVEDSDINNRQHEISNFLDETYLDFDPKILYVSFWQAKNDRDVFAQINHNHDHLEIMYLAQGECEVVIDGDSFTAHQGDVVIYDKGISHTEKPQDNNVEIYFLGVDNISLSDLAEDDNKFIYTEPRRPCGNLAEKLTSMFRELVVEIRNQMPFCQLYLSNLGSLIVLHVLRMFNTPQHTKFISKECKLIVDYLNANFNKEINLDTLANQIFFSKYYLSHMFKTQMGVSPIKYLILKRIEEAKKLLKNSDISITKIAESVGYPDPIYFGQFLKKMTGVSPSEYRTQARPCETTED